MAESQIESKADSKSKGVQEKKKEANQALAKNDIGKKLIEKEAMQSGNVNLFLQISYLFCFIIQLYLKYR